MHRTTSFVSHVIFAVIALVLFGAFIAFAWQGPLAAPPSGNVAAPINVGTIDQIKTGKFGIKSSSALVFDFEVNGTALVNSLAVYGNSVMTGTLSVTSNVTAAGFFHSSDARLKTNVQTVGGLDLVSKLRGVTFNWKKDGAPSAGVIAQEVEKVMPSAVHADADGIKSVEYDQLIAPLIEAIKEQQIQIDALKAEIEQLKK